MRTVIIDLAISIDVRLTDHFVDFLVRELLACTQKVITNERKKNSHKDTERENIPRLVMTCRNSAAEM